VIIMIITIVISDNHDNDNCDKVVSDNHDNDNCAK
jgi:hypothetical protein